MALPVAAGVIYPAGHVRLNPVWASLAMALSYVLLLLLLALLQLSDKCLLQVGVGRLQFSAPQIVQAAKDSSGLSYIT